MPTIRVTPVMMPRISVEDDDSSDNEPGQAHGAAPASASVTTQPSSCQRTRRYSQLLALFGAMPAYDVQPDAWAYSAAIDAVARVGQWERALTLLEEMESAAGDDERAAKPEQHCYGAAMRACLRVKQYRAVLELYERLRASGMILYVDGE